jgi:hypothetical protein
MVDMPIAGTATTGMGATGLGAASIQSRGIHTRGIGLTAGMMAGGGTNIRHLHAGRSRPARFPWGLVRLAICAGNGAVWVAACEALNAGLAAAIVAGIIGFVSVAMVLGSMRSQEAHLDD